MEGEQQQRVKTTSQRVSHIEHLLDAGGDPSEEAAKRWRRQSACRRTSSTAPPTAPRSWCRSAPSTTASPSSGRPRSTRRGRSCTCSAARLRLGSLVASMEEVVVVELQDAYQGLGATKWRDDREGFLKMMVLDGCFLLEVMCAAAAAVQGDGDGEGVGGGGYAANDPVFSRHGKLYVFPYVRRDMLMIENQLPLLVLQRIVTFVHGGAAPEAVRASWYAAALINSSVQFGC
uniref:Uncharacterized protein n=1 Tax=Oryza meridionalis TaxID=40149 RepID=A0A0E0EKH4_9ORYZ